MCQQQGQVLAVYHLLRLQVSVKKFKAANKKNQNFLLKNSRIDVSQSFNVRGF